MLVPSHRTRQQEVERTEAENREHVRRIDDERVLRDSEDCGQRINSKHNVCCFYGEQHQEERGDVQRLPLPEEEPWGVNTICDVWINFTRKTDDRVPFRMDGHAAVKEEFGSAVEEEDSEDIQNPVEV
jgi:hypothetical protein